VNTDCRGRSSVLVHCYIKDLLTHGVSILFSCRLLLIVCYNPCASVYENRTEIGSSEMEWLMV